MTITPGEPMRVAAIDCGTNSIRLLVADVSDGIRPTLVDVHREMRVVRLGEGVDATGRISAGALDRTWRALSDYAAVIRASGAVRVRMAATSASRDAQNRQDFVDMVRGVLGQEPEVITGAEEATLSFLGAVGDLAPDHGPFLVVDIGGGSTEFVVGRVGDDGAPDVAGRLSVDIGCVRITERILHSDPPPPAEVDAARAWAAQVLGDALDTLPLTPRLRLVAVSGTATTVAAAALRLATYDPQQIHLSRIDADRIAVVADRLLHLPRAGRASLGYMHPGRVDVIGGGALLLATLTEQLRRRTGTDQVTVSEHDILDGLALSLAP
jgi:exopolyphosphatase / guanosine-5'-triphosphate,3'-diphosphate pyrophosphatase